MTADLLSSGLTGARRSLALAAVLMAIAAVPSAASTRSSSTTDPVPEASEILSADFGWLRPRYGATASARSAWTRLRAEAEARRRRYADAATAGLKNEGIEAVRVEPSCLADIQCFLIVELDEAAADYPDWEEFAAALRSAQLGLRGTRAAIAAVRMRALGIGFRPQTIEEGTIASIVVAAIVDQALRDMIAAIPGPAAGAPLPPTGSVSRPPERLARILLAAYIMEEDVRNGRVLVAAMAEDVWPSLVKGNRLQEAWLLAQHSQDAVLQLRFLRRLRAVEAAAGTVSQNYMLLADRLEVKVAGTQTYGTQLRCEGGRFVAVALSHGIDLLGVARAASVAAPEPNASLGANC